MDIETKLSKKIYKAIDGDIPLLTLLAKHIERVADDTELQMHVGGGNVLYDALTNVADEIADSMLSNSDDV